MSAVSKIVCTLVVLIVLAGAGIGGYFLFKDSDSGSSKKAGGTYKDSDGDFSNEEATANYDPKRQVESYNTCSAGNTKRKYAVLTFDDGPDEIATPNVLEDLAAAKVKATFFMSPNALGDATAGQCNLVRTILAQGHEVQSHSFDHSNFNSKTNENIARNLYQARQWIEKCAGDQIDKLSLTQFRPPYGELTGERATYASQLGYTIAGWNIDSKDIDHKSAPEAYGKVLEDLNALDADSDAIILMHDRRYVPANSAGGKGGVKGLVQLLVDEFTTRGYTFHTGSECFSGCKPFSTVCEKPVWPRFFTG